MEDIELDDKATARGQLNGSFGRKIHNTTEQNASFHNSSVESSHHNQNLMDGIRPSLLKKNPSSNEKEKRHVRFSIDSLPEISVNDDMKGESIGDMLKKNSAENLIRKNDYKARRTYSENISGFDPGHYEEKFDMEDIKRFTSNRNRGPKKRCQSEVIGRTSSFASFMSQRQTDRKPFGLPFVHKDSLRHREIELEGVQDDVEAFHYTPHEKILLRKPSSAALKVEKKEAETAESEEKEGPTLTKDQLKKKLSKRGAVAAAGMAVGAV